MPAEFTCEVFGDSHDASRFSSGQANLDDWLLKAARGSDGRNITRTYVWHRGDGTVLGFYAIMPYIIERDSLTRRQGRGLVDSIPCYLIARLALDQALHGQHLGAQLLLSALMRIAQLSKAGGGRLAVVDASNDRAVSFYVHHGFEQIEGRPDRLIFALRSLRDRLMAPSS